MKYKKHFQLTESGVSELIGALVLISMIVLVVAVIAAGMLSRPSADKVPQVKFSVVNTTKLVDGVVQLPYSISITHDGGDEISDGTYAVFIDGNPISDFTVNPNPDKKWSVGRIIVINSTSPPGLISVYFTGTNSPTLLGQRTIGNITTTTTTTYTITASAGTGGSISPSGTVTVNSGGSQAFTISPNGGYTILNVLIDGVSQGAITSYTFTNVMTSHTISGTFITFSTAPTVTSISPATGPTAGGTVVAITGTGFTGTTTVKFGSNTAPSFTVNSATSITATSPAGTGTVDVTVTTPIGTSVTSSADLYTYSAAPTVTSISPATGPTAGGTVITITGTGFAGTTTVKFGSTTASSFTVNSATSITATSPAGTGTIDVTVTTPIGTSVTSSNDRFTYTTSSHGSNILLNSASNSGYLKDGTFFSLRTNGGGQTTNFISFSGNSPYYIGPNDDLKVIVIGDQTTGKIYMTGSVSTCDINAIAYVNGNSVGAGHISGIYIQNFKDYQSTLTYVYQGTGSMRFVVDSNILIDWGNSGYHDITIANIDETSNVLNMDWKSGSAYVVCSGDYTRIS
jgi:hypothetical protein